MANTHTHARRLVAALPPPPLPQDSNVDVAAGYASDDVVHTSARCPERKRGVPWTEEEHKLFLLGLQKVGKGDWRGISRTFVKTRTPTQVASHAQKYFLRRNNHNRRRRRSSLFDITTDMFLSSVLEDQVHQETISQPPLQPPHLSNNIQVEGFRVSTFPETLSATVLPGYRRELNGEPHTRTKQSGKEITQPHQAYPYSSCPSIFKNGRSQFKPDTHTHHRPSSFISKSLHNTIIAIRPAVTAGETWFSFSSHVRQL
ncbi:unnamed protein product [Ilex paraguariensis]|uniref:Uncharacterized protein n=1 Tax=Ilex paraguariensis TaxID=185542 RepID=A0ABC8SBC6_9AQUA